MLPVAGLIGVQFECIGLDSVGACKQSFQFRGWRTAQKGQGEVQGVPPHQSPVPMFMQPLACAEKRVAGFVTRP